MSRKKKPATPAAPVEAPARQRRPTRRTNFTPALARCICKMVASGVTLTTVCKRPRMPAERTARAWILFPGPREQLFAEMYFRARDIAVARLSDEILDIADDARNDYMIREWSTGAPPRTLDNEHVARSKLRIDTRKWLLSKLLAETFGDRPVAAKEPAATTVRAPSVQATDANHDHLAPSINKFSSKLKPKVDTKTKTSQASQPTPAATVSTATTDDEADDAPAAVDSKKRLH